MRDFLQGAVTKAITTVAGSAAAAQASVAGLVERVTGDGPLVTPVDLDLDLRDPEFIREQLPLWWLMATLYFRADVDGFEHVPDGPVLFVGNHSGGTMTPDTLVFMLAHNTEFTVDRPLYALGHQMLTNLPVLGAFAMKLGVLPAGIESAFQAFARGGSVLVYPGGDVEVFRTWKNRHQIDFDGRKGFLRLAYDAGVPIVPVVADGGHDTFMVLNDGRRLAKILKFDKLGRVKSVPVVLSLPWGINIGDWFGHIPFPAKIRIRMLEPVDLNARYPDGLDQDDAYEFVTSHMQAGLAGLAAERVLPPLR